MNMLANLSTLWSLHLIFARLLFTIRPMKINIILTVRTMENWHNSNHVVGWLINSCTHYVILEGNY